MDKLLCFHRDDRIFISMHCSIISPERLSIISLDSSTIVGYIHLQVENDEDIQLSRLGGMPGDVVTNGKLPRCDHAGCTRRK